MKALAESPKIRLGMDNFAVRAMKLKGRELVDYASLAVDTLFITDLPSLGSLKENTDAAELRREDKGVEILLGSWSICPTSKTFRKDGMPRTLALGLKLSKALGSFAFRVVLGAREDRKTPGGIEPRIEDTIRVLKSQRMAQDLGVKVAVENHAGDMMAAELITLIEGAGKDWVGANMDSGNALWTLEDPLMDSLEKLGPVCADHESAGRRRLGDREGMQSAMDGGATAPRRITRSTSRESCRKGH